MMSITSRLLNYLGQLRIYSLVDLMLMLVAAGASPASLRFWGAVFLWVGFLAHLESVHHDKGREPVPSLIAWLLWLQALVWWKNSTAGDLFFVGSLLYAQKKKYPWGLISPFMRGLQTFVIVGHIVGYNHAFPWLVATLTALRNSLGDLRDSSEDAEEGIRTWPAMWKWRSRPFVHLFGVFGTTIVWWLNADGLPLWLLPMILIVEATTYWLTPRPSNKKTAQWLHSKILRTLRR